MAIDNDLSTVLPEPPPPRPARREAAIEQALRRFDGHGQPAPPAGARPAPARHRWGRPQIAALASVALVVLVSVPIWWAQPDRILSGKPPEASPSAQNPLVAAPARATRVRGIEPPGAAGSAASARPAVPAAPAGAAPVALPDARSLAETADEAPARAAPARPDAAARTAAPAPPRDAASGTAIVVTGSRIQQQAFEATTPIVTVNEEILSNGDWNDCTLLDPHRDLGACRAFADPAAPGAAGRAGEQLAQGLALAWQGETDAAIDQFDRAIRTAPDLSIAYLNRGLAWQAKGDLRRALADLNRAVARDRTGARGYFHRSLLYRARGDAGRADADAQRAIELDPEYRAVLP